ncbi:hypothetical protein QBC37DRAFT_373303 [Rhypophila decipiens]|uniref:Uncharacterized protein n=1 Tax=Rhypophila decipiens TaxID=261697 RepID=A0AAN6Y8Y5_9PEZI|nr:hypothetical protein QBC37DRAFT_373303 [Rhypophila decipiens]
MERFITWLRKPLNTSVLTAFNKPRSTQSSVPSIKVQVNSVLDDKDTTASAITKGLISLSNAGKIINDLSPAEGTQNVTDAIADIIINVINTMATVRHKHRPTRIHAYHVYATRTGIASFIHIRNPIVTPYQSDPGTVVKDIFSAYVYLGMAILVTPAPYAAYLASSLAGPVYKAANAKTVWSHKQAYAHACELIRIYTPNLTAYSGRIPPPPLSPALRPLVGIVRSQQLAGLALALAHKQRRTFGTVEHIVEAVEMLETLFIPPESVCPCRRRYCTVCFCTLKPMSRRDLSRRDIRYYNGDLLPEI